jgi:hypothetical protein
MEKVEVSRNFIDGCGQYPDKEFINYEYQFTHEEKESLEIILIKFKPSSVKLFISHLQFYCQDMLNIISNPARTDHKEKLEYLLKVFKAALPSIKRLERGNYLLSYTRSISDLHHERDKISQDSHYQSKSNAVNLDGLKLSWEVSAPLNDLITKIDNQLKEAKRTRGRPESYSKGFVKAISEIYIKYFQEKPTTYDEGTFAEVVRHALEAVGLPSNDPSGLIKQILK